jgi:hypothetical protein
MRNPGVATLEQTGEDQMTLAWESADGSASEMDMSLRQAADLQAGEPVSGYGLVRRATPQERIARLRAMNDQIAERMADLEDQYPDLREG